jgi:ABC-type dipeptide/oligopeptide/nickel transport system permease component
VPAALPGRLRQIVEQYNLDQSIWVRPFGWFGDAISGDLGDSVALGQPVTEVLWDRGSTPR